MAEAAAFIQASREDLAKRATGPTTELLREIALDQLSPAQRRERLGQEFTASLAGTDATAVATTARALIQANEQFFGRSSLFFDSQRFIQSAIEGFNERLREQALSDNDAVQQQTTALSADQESRYAAALQKKLGRAVRLRTKVDQTLLGGAVLKAGDLVIDGSIKGRLDRLATELTA